MCIFLDNIFDYLHMFDNMLIMFIKIFINIFIIMDIVITDLLCFLDNILDSR